MSALAEDLVRLVFEEARRQLAELERRALGDAAPAKRKKRKGGDAIATAFAVEAGTKSVARSGSTSDGRIVLVSIDGKVPVLAKVVNENPKPGFKTIRLAKGSTTKRFSTKEHRVLDSEIRRDATEDEYQHGLVELRRQRRHANGAAAEVLS